MKTFKEFRTEWILDPSKEMVVESEIIDAYYKYKLNTSPKPLISDNDITELLDDLSQDANKEDAYSYGLPLYGSPLKTLISTVRTWINKSGC